jgi:hypothetical protein
MRLSRTLIVLAVIALTALATVWFSAPSADSAAHEEAAAEHAVALTATSGATPLSHGPFSLGPIPCLDGSTVDLGQLCPLPTIQCANGTSVPIGQFCPRDPGTEQKKPPPLVTCPDGSTAPNLKACAESGGDANTPQTVACPDGTVLPAGQPCPQPKPAPVTATKPVPNNSGFLDLRPVTTVTYPDGKVEYRCDDGYTYDAGQGACSKGPIIR